VQRVGGRVADTPLCCCFTGCQAQRRGRGHTLLDPCSAEAHHLPGSSLAWCLAFCVDNSWCADPYSGARGVVAHRLARYVSLLPLLYEMVLQQLTLFGERSANCGRVAASAVPACHCSVANDLLSYVALLLCSCSQCITPNNAIAHAGLGTDYDARVLPSLGNEGTVMREEEKEEKGLTVLL
jgi:hypothetical protein